MILMAQNSNSKKNVSHFTSDKREHIRERKNQTPCELEATRLLPLARCLLRVGTANPPGYPRMQEIKLSPTRGGLDLRLVGAPKKIAPKKTVVFFVLFCLLASLCFALRPSQSAKHLGRDPQETNGWTGKNVRVRALLHVFFLKIIKQDLKLGGENKISRTCSIH